MSTNVIGIIFSFIYIGLVLFSAYIIRKKTKIRDEFVRKFVHILTANWWFILLYFVGDFVLAAAGPIVFIFANSLFVFYPSIGAHIGCPDKKRNLGLIYYPLSILVLILLMHAGYIETYAATIGILCMGYGDGFAAIFGKIYGKKKITLPTGGKTVFGSFVMLIVCFLASFIVLTFTINLPMGKNLLVSLGVGIVAAVFEMVTPLGLDNISVPLLSALMVGVLL